MSRLTAILDWLDDAASALIRLAYLAAGVTAVAVYFGAGQLPAWLDSPLNAALPWALAAALETHTYLTARRVRVAWQERDRDALLVNLAVLAVLLAFSAWNQLGYLGGVWTPPTTGALALPRWLAYLVRALIVPCAFMAAAFLAPLAPPITAQIEGEARATLDDVFKIARRQRRQFLREAARSGRDLTGALVELVPDEQIRGIIRHAYAAIGAGVSAQVSARDVTLTAEEALATVRRELSLPYLPLPAPITPYDLDDSDDLPPDEPPEGPGGPSAGVALRLTPDLADATPALLRPVLASTATPSNRYASRRRRKPEPHRRRDQLAVQALDRQRRAEAFALLNANPATTANAIAQTLKCRWRTANRYKESWKSQRLSQPA